MVGVVAMEVLVEVVMVMVVGVVRVASSFEAALSLVFGFVIDDDFVVGNSEEDAEDGDDELRKLVVVLTERETIRVVGVLGVVSMAEEVGRVASFVRVVPVVDLISFMDNGDDDNEL